MLVYCFCFWCFEKKKNDILNLRLLFVFNFLGDIFEVLSKDSANWWTARYNGVTALLPANYCEEI